jgi:hypothetical protein
LGKFAKVIKYIFIIALLAFLAALFLRICQSDHKALENIDITNNFKGVCDYIDSSVKNLCTHNPSVSTADSSLYTREPL